MWYLLFMLLKRKVLLHIKGFVNLWINFENQQQTNLLIWVSFYFCKNNPVYLHMFYVTLSVFVYFSVFSCSSFSLARWPAKVGRIRPQRSRPRHHQTFHKAGPDTPADSETTQSDSWDRPPAQYTMCSFFLLLLLHTLSCCARGAAETKGDTKKSTTGTANKT